MNVSECACSHCRLLILLERHMGKLMGKLSETNASCSLEQLCLFHDS